MKTVRLLISASKINTFFESASFYFKNLICRIKTVAKKGRFSPRFEFFTIAGC